MTVVSESDLWMFVSSTGALTAGRIDADHALFPYETVDRLHRAAGVTGPVTVIAQTVGGERRLWRPFGVELGASCTRSISKSVLGDRLVFEEHHADWGLDFRATWAPSSTHGWVRTVEIVDVGGRGAELEVLDGLLDVMPAGVDARTEQTLSNLVDSYKRSETGPWATLAVYTLEALITDRAEPAESLTATTVWSSGFVGAEPDLDARAVAAMIDGRRRDPSRLVTGRPGAYLLRGALSVPASGAASWMIVADTGLAHPDLVEACGVAGAADPVRVVGDDIAAGSARLRTLLADADAFQSTGTASPMPITCPTCCSTRCAAGCSRTDIRYRCPTWPSSSASAIVRCLSGTRPGFAHWVSGSTLQPCATLRWRPATTTSSGWCSSTCRSRFSSPPWRPQPSVEPILDQHPRRQWRRAAVVRGQLARHFPELGGTAPLVPRLFRQRRRQVRERIDDRWIQPVSHHTRRHRLGGARPRRSVESHRLLGRPPDRLSAAPARSLGAPRAGCGPEVDRSTGVRLCRRALRDRRPRGDGA